jgi:hypothetical protein
MGFRARNLELPQLAWHSNVRLWVAAFTFAAASVATFLGLRPNNSKPSTLCGDVAYMLVIGVSVWVG